MYAVIQTGGKQYRVARDNVLAVERLDGEPGDVVAFDKVLAIGEGESVDLAPEDAKVLAEILEQKRDDKIIVFKKKRRKKYRRKAGHRQYKTVLRVTDILA